MIGDERPRLRAILFDVGGTLVREPDLVAWVAHAHECGLPLDAELFGEAYVEILAEVDGEPRPRDRPAAVLDFWRRTLARAARRNVSESTASRFVAACGEYSDPVQLYPDARRCLDLLRQDRRSLGVISNSRSESRVRQVLRQVEILEYFDAIVSSGTEGVEKPDPEIFLRTVRRMGVAPAEALYVGNLALTDAKAARSAGLYGVWLNRERLLFSEELPEVSSLLDVPVYVRQIEEGRAAV